MWKHDHPTVQHCLLIAAQAMKLQVTRRQQVDKMLTAAQNRNNNINEVIREGDTVWLSVPDKVIDAARLQLRKTHEQQFTDKKMLVRVSKVTQVVSRFGRGITEHFTILTQDGLLHDTYPIDELERCPAPPSTHPIVAKTVSSSTSKRVALVTAYRAYCRWDAARSTIAQKNKKTKTLGVARKIRRINAESRAMTPSLTPDTSQPPPSQEAVDAASILQAVASSSTSNRERVIVEVDDDEAADIPCSLCRIPLTAATRQCCMLNSCLRPFCAVNASCTRAVRVEGLLVYCSMQCAQKDGKQLPARRPLTSSQPASSTGTTVAPPKPTFAWDSFTYTCNTCLLPITHDVKTWCNTCLKYVHKKTKGQPWCTRERWTRGGTTVVDTLIICIECRFAKDQEWLDFTKSEGQLAS